MIQLFHNAGTKDLDIKTTLRVKAWLVVACFKEQEFRLEENNSTSFHACHAIYEIYANLQPTVKRGGFSLRISGFHFQDSEICSTYCT